MTTSKHASLALTLSLIATGIGLIGMSASDSVNARFQFETVLWTGLSMSLVLIAIRRVIEVLEAGKDTKDN